ncbi:CPBP family intramembrane glutamic endopeptidase [Klenkia sp. PcliD-1-E]|uniref:CPBP family intramembrane glutamic endopeptidase n=1 Tax=Klenkia sp. PcliD-1-E TaxID=2954492 RepID=UPI002097CA5B|nr:CPBP family intramembrane glutamic endopeptidase [Klenkia sp. PcliD-1-E]MCO7220539.1 CPBP family intramembrane metalloprotease [Klenkia sp. PcliD-1-E]
MRPDLDDATTAVPRRWLVTEVWLVFALSLGASGVRAAVQFVGALLEPAPLAQQAAVLNGSAAPGRPGLDLALQLVYLATGLVPVLLVVHLLTRSGEGVRPLGLRPVRPGADLARGVGLAALVGGTGLAFYLAARGVGANLTVVPEALPDTWWRIPVLVLSAGQNAVLEEVLVAAYLLHRLRQLGWSDGRALAVSAVLRGSYHLYQGLGGFVGNVAMGLLFGRLYQRWGRVGPLVVAHTLIDVVAFVGYALLVGHVSWLPGAPGS